MILERAERPGRNAMIDGSMQLPGVSPDQITSRGAAIVSKSLKSATFSLGGAVANQDHGQLDMRLAA